MKDNLPPDSNPQGLASRESGIVKTERQLLIEAETKIGQMENERRLGMEHIEKMKWQIAQLRMGVAALATHFGQTPDQVKVIYDAYCAAEDAKLSEQGQAEVKAAKAEFMRKLAAGEKVDFNAVERAPEGAPDSEAKPEDN